MTGKPVYNNKEEIKLLRGSIQDVTTFYLKEASTQEALAASKTAIFEWFPLKERMEVDSNWYLIFEIEQQDTNENLKIWLESIHPEDREEFEKASQYAFSNLSSFDLSYRIVTHKGDTKYVQVRFKIIRDEMNDPVRVFGTITDVTRIKLTETELKEQYKLMAQTTKMVQLGEISAGIGHEINNPLAIALGNHRLLERVLSKNILENEADKTLFEKALNDQKESLIRIKNLVKNLKNFAHIKGHESQVFDVSETLKDTAELFKVLLNKKDINLTLNIKPVLTTKGNKERFNQVVTNLLSNAIDALESSEKKIISLSASQENKVITLVFQDSGKGIPEDIQGKIFKQFFTTKEVAKGTDIGLALSRSII